MINFTQFVRVLPSAFLSLVFTLGLATGTIQAFASPADLPLTVVITQQPSAATVCEGSNATFTVAATGSGALSYQWEVSTDAGANWNTITNDVTYNGAATASLQISNAPAAMNGWYYRCVVSDGSSATSASALLSVNPTPTVQSSNIAVQVCINGSATITAASYAGVNYQWQVNSGAGFTNVTNGGIYSGATTSMLRITGVPASMEGYLYRYIATNSTTGCTATSALDTLHVVPYAAITKQPVVATVCPGSDTSFTVEASGVSSVKWQVSTNGSTWTDVANNATYSGAATTTLSVSNPGLSMNNYRYRAVLYNALSCPVSSNTVFLFVRSFTNITSQPSNTTVCTGSTATFSTTATGSSLTYQWQTDNGTNGATWTNITPGGTSATLNRANVTTPMNGYRFRVLVNGYCGSMLSAEATLQTKRGTWLGVTSTDWHTASNWCGGVPDNTTDVLIPAGAPNMPDIISGIGYSNSLTIEPEAKLTISGGTTQMNGPFSLQGTVAYTGNGDQPVLPAAHTSLEINGSGKKFLQASTDVYENLVLGGTAKLVTSGYLLTMKAGSNPISGTGLSYASTSWIVTGNGNAGAANTGLGGLRYETIASGNGNVLFPVGPTDSAYNPLFLENKGVADQFTVTVNDQPIPGSYAGKTINRTWKVTEGTPGGSQVTLDLKWNRPEEQPLFDTANVLMVRSAGSAMVENREVQMYAGRPMARVNSTEFFELTEFSLHTFTAGDMEVLPVKLLSFSAKKLAQTKALVQWSVANASGKEKYVVQRSLNSVQAFVDMAGIKAEAGKTTFSIRDENLPTGVTYYRLKMINQNGAIEFSPVAKVTNDADPFVVQLRPSVTTSTTTNLAFSLKGKERIHLLLMNAAGQMQWSKTIELQAGNHLLPVDLSSLSSGLYFIHVNGSKQQVLSLIKQ